MQELGLRPNCTRSLDDTSNYVLNEMPATQYSFLGINVLSYAPLGESWAPVFMQRLAWKIDPVKLA